MDETITTPAVGAADDPARERKVVEFLRGDPGVRLPPGFREAVERAIAAEPAPVDIERASDDARVNIERASDDARVAAAPTPGGRRSRWSWRASAVLVALNLVLVAALFVIPRLYPPESDEPIESGQDVGELVELQGRLIEQQHLVIRHLKTVQEHEAVVHEGALLTLRRDLLTKQIAEIEAMRRSLEETIDGLKEREARLLGELTESESKRVETLKRLVDAQGMMRRLEERLAQGPSADQVDSGIAALQAEREREEAAGAARLAALDREIVERGGDPSRPPASIEPVIGRERGVPWTAAAAKVVEAGGATGDGVLLDAGKADGLVAGTRFLAYHEGFGGALAYRAQVEVVKTLEGTSEARRVPDSGMGALEPGLLLFNPFWRRPGERRTGVRVAIAGPTPGLDRVRPRFLKALADLGVVLEARVDERTELVLVERDYALDPGFRLAHGLRLPILHVARLTDYLVLPGLELDAPVAPTAESLALDKARLAELLAIELAEGSRLRGALEQLGPRMKALSQGSRELASARARLRAEIARREAHLEHLKAHPPARDPPARDDRQGMLDQHKPDGRVMCQEVQPMTVRIDRGREQRLAVGLTFEAYRPLRGDKREPRARLVVTKLEAREAICRVVGRYHDGKYLSLPNQAAFDDLPARVKTAFAAEPLGEELIASALYDPERPRVVVLLGQLRGRWANPEVTRLLGELGDRVVEDVDARVDFAIAGMDHESDPRYAEVKRLGIRIVPQAELYGWLGD